MNMKSIAMTALIAIVAIAIAKKIPMVNAYV